jgi:diguanylate cyclase
MSALPITTTQSPSELLAQAVLCEEGGGYVAGVQFATQAADQSHGVDEALHASALECLALLQSELGESEDAAKAAHSAVAIRVALGDLAGQAGALCVVANVYTRLGLTREGCDFAMQALELARRIDHRPMQCKALHQISRYHIAVGELDDAQRLLRQSLAIAREQNDRRELFWALNNVSHVLGLLANQCAAQGDSPASEALIARMLPILDETTRLAKDAGNMLWQAFAVSNLADVYILRGDELRARALIDEYAALAREIDFHRLLAYAQMDEVRLLVARGQHGQVIQLLTTPVHRALIAEQVDFVLDTDDALYRAHKALGDFQSALVYLEAHAAQERARLTLRSEKQARVLLARMDLAQAQATAERAQIETQVQQLRANALEQERDVLAHKALEDSLTHIGNRRAADQLLGAVMAHPFGDRNRLVVALADVDHFKKINDQHGHAVGDLVLVEMAQLMKESLRLHDSVFRYGGEEFLLVCSRIRARIETFNWRSLGRDLRVTVSIGLATRRAGDSLAALVERADGALYSAKNAGRNRVVRG